MANEKLISTQALIEKFQKALHDHWGYIWGTAGVKWTEEKQSAIEKTTEKKYEKARKYGKKWIGHTVSDCSGLFSWAFKQLGGTMYHGSNTMYLKWCTDKGQLQKGRRTDGRGLKPGTAVFIWDGSTYSHVGLYIGDGVVIEAASTQKGVTTSKVSDGKWTHWGELKGVDYSGVTEEPMAEIKPTLKRGSKGDYVRILQTMLENKGYDLGSYGIDGDYGRATEAAVKAFQKDHGLKADGICGEKTWAALGEAEPEKTWTVTIKGLTRAKAEEIITMYGGTLAEER